ncbi:MAG: DMT family transporter [Synergistaceae bacterium]|nr:DMT family transporter [Synergistaceae bacterium]
METQIKCPSGEMEFFMGKQLRGMTMLMITAFIWGTAFVAQRFGMDHVGPVTFIAVRFAVGGVSLLPAIWINSLFRRNREQVEENSHPNALLLGGLYCGVILFVCTILQQVGIIYTTVGKSGFITTLYIVIVPILGLFIGRKSPLFTWCCVAAAVIGMYMLCVSEAVSLNKGDVYTLGCAFFYAVHILVIDRYSPIVDGVKLSCIQFFVCGAIAFAAAFIFEQPELSAIISAWAPILYTGVLSSGLAYTFQILGQKDVNPVAASLIMSLESVFAVLTGWVILGETLSSREITGCILIFTSNMLIQIWGLRNHD